MASKYTVPGMDRTTAEAVATTLQNRLVSLIDLHLTLKHIHWNVVGPNFIGVHEMLDEQFAGAQKMTDAVAERIATLGFVPIGTPGHIASHRSWEDYSIGRAFVQEHLAALNVAYDGLITDHRKAIEEFEKLDLVSQDLLIEQTEKLEMYQWFVRAHLEDSAGNLPSGSGEQDAAQAAAERG